MVGDGPRRQRPRRRAQSWMECLRISRAVAIARQIDTLQQSLLQLIDHAEHDAQEAGGVTGTVDKLDELQHLTSQLARTLGWKRVFQSIVVETESEVCTLARLRVLILGGVAEGEGSRMEVE